MKFKVKYWFVTGLILTIIVFVCMNVRPAADFYSEEIYPLTSAVLSFIASPFPFSLQSILITIFVLSFLLFLVLSLTGKMPWKKSICRIITLALWIFVWAYAGWCINYSRSSILVRASVSPAAYDSLAFASFLRDYTCQLNASYTEDDVLDSDSVESELKDFYCGVPESMGLCKPKPYQHPKRMMVSSFQSSFGVTGFIGPFFCETHLNRELLPREYPYALAHEMSHLLGVSSEAEANWWAWKACCSSETPMVRYSAYCSVLPYVWFNALGLLSKDDFEKWKAGISPDVLNDWREESAYWREKRVPAIDKVQTFIYDFFLKSNGISSGMCNYSEVVGLIMALDSVI